MSSLLAKPFALRPAMVSAWKEALQNGTDSAPVVLIAKSSGEDSLWLQSAVEYLIAHLATVFQVAERGVYLLVDNDLLPPTSSANKSCNSWKTVVREKLLAGAASGTSSSGRKDHHQSFFRKTKLVRRRVRPNCTTVDGVVHVYVAVCQHHAGEQEGEGGNRPPEDDEINSSFKLPPPVAKFLARPTQKMVFAEPIISSALRRVLNKDSMSWEAVPRHSTSNNSSSGFTKRNVLSAEEEVQFAKKAMQMGFVHADSLPSSVLLAPAGEKDQSGKIKAAPPRSSSGTTAPVHHLANGLLTATTPPTGSSLHAPSRRERMDKLRQVAMDLKQRIEHRHRLHEERFLLRNAGGDSKTNGGLVDFCGQVEHCSTTNFAASSGLVRGPSAAQEQAEQQQLAGPGTVVPSHLADIVQQKIEAMRQRVSVSDIMDEHNKVVEEEQRKLLLQAATDQDQNKSGTATKISTRKTANAARKMTELRSNSKPKRFGKRQEDENMGKEKNHYTKNHFFEHDPAKIAETAVNLEELPPAAADCDFNETSSEMNIKNHNDSNFVWMAPDSDVEIGSPELQGNKRQAAINVNEDNNNYTWMTGDSSVSDENEEGRTLSSRSDHDRSVDSEVPGEGQAEENGFGLDSQPDPRVVNNTPAYDEHDIDAALQEEQQFLATIEEETRNIHADIRFELEKGKPATFGLLFSAGRTTSPGGPGGGIMRGNFRESVGLENKYGGKNFYSSNLFHQENINIRAQFLVQDRMQHGRAGEIF
ncbi:unnamed protein product [Amoebophrya sp. A120]|nr:unnamed protein product [Amoebophrya sp. A120]|eukprot:GSA120T00016824001.1